MNRHFLSILCLFLSFSAAFAQPSHDIFNAVISSCVTSDGKIDYQKLKNESRQLDDYLKELEKNPPKFEWSKNEEKAFWINAYNAFTLRLVLDNYPIKSILLIDGGKAFSKKQFKVGKEMLSLDDIEHRRLRKMGDSRIHFAISCAAQSSPMMPNHVFYTNSLDIQLNSATKKYVASLNLEKTPGVSDAKTVSLPKIFEWYADDFVNVIAFLNKYSQANIEPSTRLIYQDYDWSLNEVLPIVSKK